MSIDRDAVKLRLEATRDATSRSRFALLASTVAALSFLIAEFNAYISWNRDFALAPGFASATSPTGMAQRRLLDDWVTSSSMNISLLGIHASASDATILGGIALFFLTLWMYYSMRRENRLVGTLLRNTRDSDLGLMDLAFSGTISYMVFTAVAPGKPPIDTLSDKPTGHGHHGVSFLGVQLLFLLPPIAILVSLTFDIVSILVLEAPFRESHRMPTPQGLDLLKIGAYTAVGVLCLIATIVNSSRVRKFDRATGRILREYNALLHAKMELVTMLTESPETPKRVALPADAHGISCSVILNADNVTHIEFKFDQAHAGVWEKIKSKQAEIRSRHHVGAVEFGPSKSLPDRVLLLSVLIGDSEDKRIQYAVRELFRMTRTMYAYLSTDGPAQDAGS